jgi:hypothetical protein
MIGRVLRTKHRGGVSSPIVNRSYRIGRRFAQPAIMVGDYHGRRERDLKLSARQAMTIA